MSNLENSNPWRQIKQTLTNQPTQFGGQQFLAAMLWELKEQQKKLNNQEWENLTDHDSTAYDRLIDPTERNFFIYKFIDKYNLFIKQANLTNKKLNILDFGCGFGSVSLLLSLMGHNVWGIDLDPGRIAIATKRKVFIEEQLGETLNIEFTASDIFKYDFSRVPAFDLIVSLSVLFMVPGFADLPRLFNQITGNKARIAICDANLLSWAYLSKARRGYFPGPSPTTFSNLLSHNGFTTTLLQGECGLPPVMVNNSWISPLSIWGEKLLMQHIPGFSLRWGTTYQLIAEKK